MSSVPEPVSNSAPADTSTGTNKRKRNLLVLGGATAFMAIALITFFAMRGGSPEQANDDNKDKTEKKTEGKKDAPPTDDKKGGKKNDDPVLVTDGGATKKALSADEQLKIDVSHELMSYLKLGTKDCPYTQSEIGVYTGDLGKRALDSTANCLAYIDARYGNLIVDDDKVTGWLILRRVALNAPKEKWSKPAAFGLKETEIWSGVRGGYDKKSWESAIDTARTKIAAYQDATLTKALK